jgi:catechol 2,3-dioxygenase
MANELAPIDPALRIASVSLAVGELARSVAFYEHTLGLPVISRDERSAQLGFEDEHPALLLGELAEPTVAPPHSTGLFHVAWLHPSRAALAATVRRVARAGWPIDGASDHGVSEALYLRDPDGLGIEIYVDRPREQWERSADGHGVNMVTLPLDLDDLLAQGQAEHSPAIEPGTHVGHVHFKVADVPRSARFYREALGFSEQAQMPSAAFLAAGGYHHHVGMNSWQSQRGTPPPENAPGLRRVDFELSGADALDALRTRLANANGDSVNAGFEDGRISVHDPDGELLRFHQS